MSETERELVNELLETILAKDPSLLDITATIESTLESISAVTRQSELRTKLEGILQLQIRIAGVADTALRASFNGLIAARNDKKIAYLTDSLSLHRFAEENDGFKKQLDEYFQKTSANNLVTSTMVWSALTADD